MVELAGTAVSVEGSCSGGGSGDSSGGGEVEVDLLGGLVKMRILTPGEPSIWRIGSLQSANGSPSEKVVTVAIVDGDWLPGIDERDDAKAGGGSVKHHKGMFWISLPTLSSPSSCPWTSRKMSGGEKGDKKATDL